jgi:beta-hydroxylase
MTHAVLSPQVLVFGAWLATAAYVHFRGRVRHTLGRQLLNYSTFLAPYSAFVYLFAREPRARFFDPREFPELAPLRREWKIIREEAEQLLRYGDIREAARRDDIAFNSFFRRGWKRFYVKWYDEPLPSARLRCPRTVELIATIPSVHAALFALLPPGAKLGEHRDPFAGSLRYHLGLITPNSDDCRIWVDGEPYAWRDGEDVVFDETFIHWARNDTDQTRVILFCDVERPLRTPVARALNRFVIRHVVRHTSSNNESDERLGAVSRLASRIHAVQAAGKRLKRANRTLYRAVQAAAVVLPPALALLLCAR